MQFQKFLVTELRLNLPLFHNEFLITGLARSLSLQEIDNPITSEFSVPELLVLSTLIIQLVAKLQALV